MGQLSLTIAGRSHVVACRDGEEDALEALVHRLERHVPAAIRAAGPGGPERTLLYVALMLADELAEAQASVGKVSALADRLERLAETLENGGAPA